MEKICKLTKKNALEINEGLDRCIANQIARYEEYDAKWAERDKEGYMAYGILFGLQKDLEFMINKQTGNANWLSFCDPALVDAYFESGEDEELLIKLRLDFVKRNAKKYMTREALFVELKNYYCHQGQEVPLDYDYRYEGAGYYFELFGKDWRAQLYSNTYPVPAYKR